MKVSRGDNYMAGFFQSKADDVAKLVLRIMLGGILLFHGVAKLIHGVGWLQMLLGNLGLPGILAYGPYIGEFVAPILLIVGILTRPAALVIAFDMVMAVALVGSKRIFMVGQSGGWALELEGLIFLSALAIFFAGAGKYSVTGTKSTWL